MKTLMQEVTAALQVNNPHLNLPAFVASSIDMGGYLQLTKVDPSLLLLPHDVLHSYVAHILDLHGAAACKHVRTLAVAYVHPHMTFNQRSLLPYTLHAYNPTPPTLNPDPTATDFTVDDGVSPSDSDRDGDSDRDEAPPRVPSSLPAAPADLDFTFPQLAVASAAPMIRLAPSSPAQRQPHTPAAQASFVPAVPAVDAIAAPAVPVPSMDAYLAAVAGNPELIHELPLPPQLEHIVQLKKVLRKGGKKRHRRASPPSSDSSSSDSDASSGEDKDKGRKGVPRDPSPDSSSSDTDASSDTSSHKAHKGKSKKNGHVVKYGLPPMPMFDGSLKPGEGDDKSLT
jgi:hypothetical protein